MEQLARHMISGGLLSCLLLASMAQGAPLGGVVGLQSTLAGGNEVPPNTSTATGSLDATFNQDSRVLNYSLSYSGLSGPAKGGHFHGPALAGANAEVVLPLIEGLQSPIKGTAILTPSQAADLLAGRWYVNLHTAAHPGGEIRGQVGVR